MPSELTAFGEIASHLANPLVLIGLALLLAFGVHRALISSGTLPPVDQRTSGVIAQSLLRYGFWISALLIVLGIGYAGWKTYRETQAAIVNAETVSTAIKVLSKQLQTKELRMQEYQDRNKALTEAVQALAKKQDTPGVKQALAALAQGRTEAAKAIFTQTVEAKTAEGAAANQEAAEAARHLGALAFLDNTEEALRWYRRPSSSIPRTPTGGITWVISIAEQGTSTRQRALIGRSLRSVRRTVTWGPLPWAPAASGSYTVGAATSTGRRR